MKKKLLIMILLTFALIFNTSYVNAASLDIKANNYTVTTGSTVKVTVSANGLTGKFSVSSSDSGVLSGGINGDWLENNSKTYTFNAKKVGTATITVNAVNAADSSTSVNFTGSKTITIKVVKPREKSTNNDLKTLKVEGSELSPEFNKDTLEYTVSVESSVEKVKIIAETEDGYASMTGDGEKEVSEGDNEFAVVVTSETGIEKKYTIKVIVADSTPIVKEYKNKNYTIVKRSSLLEKPNEEFIETTTTIDNNVVPAFYNEKLDITVIVARDEQQRLTYFVYNENNNTIEKYEQIVSEPVTIVIGNTEEEIEGYEKKSVDINGQDYEGYQIDNSTVLIYGKNIKNNKEGWYKYNLKEQSIQSFDVDNYLQSIEDNENKINEYKVVVLVLSGLTIFLLLILVIVIISKRKLRQELLIQKVNLGIEDEKPIIPEEEMIIYDEKKSKKKVKKEENKVEKTSELKEEKKKEVKEEIAVKVEPEKEEVIAVKIDPEKEPKEKKSRKKV